MGDCKKAYQDFLGEFDQTIFKLHTVNTAEEKIDFYESYRQATAGENLLTNLFGSVKERILSAVLM